MAHDVFISYASENKPVADAVCAKLEARRIRCWIAPRDLLPGAPYSEALVEAIQGSRVLVLVFSAFADRSPHVMREVEAAVDHEVAVLPFRIEDVEPGKLRYFIKSIHWLNALTPPLETHIAELAETVQAHLGRPRRTPGEPEAHAAMEKRAARGVGSWPWLIIAICLIFIGIGTASWMWRDHLFPSKRDVNDVPKQTEGPKFITTAMTYELIARDLQSAKDPKKRRYISLAHLSNDPTIEPALLKRWQNAMPRASISLNESKTLYGIDWEYTEKPLQWTRIVDGDPYALTYDDNTLGDAKLAAIARLVREKSGTPRPFLRADWFLVRTRRLDPEGAHADLLEAWKARSVGVKTAAADIGLADPARLITKVTGSERLRDIGLMPLANGGDISRQAWESQDSGLSPFQEAAQALGLGVPFVD